MTKGPSAKFGVEVSVTGPDGKLKYNENGQVLKKTIRMGNGKFADGTDQEFYFPDGHPQAGQFKGLAIILQERGFENAQQMKLQYGGKWVDCKEPTGNCCCRRTLFNQPDFVNVESWKPMPKPADFVSFFCQSFTVN